ncbi:MAG: hypothetical protein COW62_11850, partial [Zetaproteobacteria bacterium CG17_big_fil_post_rev_8_21_14_2_50_50_13]
MTDRPSSRQQLIAENAALRARLLEAEDTLRAIRSGEADALVLSGSEGDYIYTLKGGQEPYRVMVESMNEGAVTLAVDGTILYCNGLFADWIRLPPGQIIGTSMKGMLAEQDRIRFAAMLVQATKEESRGALKLQAANGLQLPALFSMSPLPQSVGKVISVIIADLSEVLAAARARARLALIVESSDDAIVSTTLNGIVESWNKAAELLYGYAAGEVVGHSIESLIIPPECSDEIAQEFKAIRRGERALLADSVRLHKDGSVINVSIKASPTFDAAGKVVGASINARNISERKRVETELRQSEYAYRTLSQNLPGMVYRVHLLESERMQFYNDLPVQITGYAAHELAIGKVCSIKPLIHDEDRPGVQAQVSSAIAGNRAFVVEYRLKHKDGGIRWVQEHGMPVYEADGAPLYIDGVIFDITEQKQAAIKLQLFRTLIDNSSDAIEALDPVTLGFLDVNETECRDLGYSREELMSMKITDIDSTFKANEIAAQIRKTGNSRFESIHRRKDGSTFPVEVSSKRVELDKPYVLNIARDITKRKLAEAEVQKLQEQLRQQALHDPLTGLYNRRYLDEAIERELI